MTNTARTHTATLQVHGGISIRVEVPTTVAPLGARRSEGAALRLLRSYADVLRSDDSIIDGRVEVREVEGSGTWFVALFEYDREVRL